MLHRLLSPFILVGSLLFPHSTQVDKLVTKTEASVLRITGEADFQTMFGIQHGTYVCSAFLVDDNLAVTAAHCIGEDMRTDGVPIVRVIKKSDEVLDLAYIEVISGKHPLQLSEEAVKRGDELVGVGYGFGFDRPMYSAGKVLYVDYSPVKDGSMAPGIWIDSAYHGGMSGGPVVSQDGRVVGIVQQASDGIGYGVGSLLIKAFLLGAR